MDPGHDQPPDFDVVLVGGGLAAALASLALLDSEPSVRLAIIERAPRLGGNHTWCFHAADVPAAAQRIVAPLIVQRWDGYQVRFPGRSRRLASPYACITSERLHDVVHARFAATRDSALRLGMAARHVGAHEVTLADDTRLTAGLVIDARGPSLPSEGGGTAPRCGYQKFVGLELSVAPHALTEPVMFDACIPQRDGFRFMYMLPLARDRVLIEETFFSDQPGLDQAQGERAVLAYTATQGLRVRELLRSEHGVLPMPWSDQSAAPFDVAARPLSAGYRAGLFHPVTGYSLPLAVRFALALSQSDRAHLAHSPLSQFARAHAAQTPFLHLLTRLLFTAFAPAQRFHVLEHFYRLPEPLIERFYAAELSALDRARVFLGAPPRGFSFGRALGFGAGAAS